MLLGFTGFTGTALGDLFDSVKYAGYTAGNVCDNVYDAITLPFDRATARAKADTVTETITKICKKARKNMSEKHLLKSAAIFKAIEKCCEIEDYEETKEFVCSYVEANDNLEIRPIVKKLLKEVLYVSVDSDDNVIVSCNSEIERCIDDEDDDCDNPFDLSLDYEKIKRETDEQIAKKKGQPSRDELEDAIKQLSNTNNQFTNFACSFIDGLGTSLNFTKTSINKMKKIITEIKSGNLTKEEIKDKQKEFDEILKKQMNRAIKNMQASK